MDITISITDPQQVLGLQRAAAAQSAASGLTVTEDYLVRACVATQCQAWADKYLITRVDPLDFQMRFTADERVAIRTAAQSNGQIADYLGLLTAASSVNLTDPVTMAGVQALETAGLIAQGRAAQILAL
jgi:hypothetical protein